MARPEIALSILSADGTRVPIGSGGFEASETWRPGEGDVESYDVQLVVRYTRDQPARAGVRVAIELPRETNPFWLIPGLFYGENRRSDNRAQYPRWDPRAAGDEPLTSDHWSFRADRAALPMVFALGDAASVGLWAADRSPLGDVGVGFVGDGSLARIWLDAPACEEPVSYVAANTAGPQTLGLHEWQAGEEHLLRFVVFMGPGGRDAYREFVRHAYWRSRQTNPLRPWMTPTRAADLAAYGLRTWHYRAEHAALFETAAFDREALGERGDRPHMHVAWVSGAPWAAALLRYGRTCADDESIAAGTAVLDKIATGLAPCGVFWGEWRVDGGWSAGWNAGGTLHARTLSEATMFVTRALVAEQSLGIDRPGWRAAVESNLEFVARRQRDDGNLGAYYDPQTGAVVGWEGAAGLGWVAALAEGAQALNRPDWLAAAERAGGYYARFVEDSLIYGAPEDVNLTPTSEDGYQAVIAYVALHRATGDPRWLELARRAADWMLTFRYAYNVGFSPDTILGAYDFRTRGADQASPANQHLHAYGLICLPEMLELWRVTGDDYYLARTRDNLACFLQFIARDDGDFNAYRGMVSERYYQTDWSQAKGMLLTLSHAWSVGVVLHASLVAENDLEAFGDGWWQ